MDESNKKFIQSLMIEIISKIEIIFDKTNSNKTNFVQIYLHPWIINLLGITHLDMGMYSYPLIKSDFNKIYCLNKINNDIEGILNIIIPNYE